MIKLLPPFCLSLCCACQILAAAEPVKLDVDATEIQRKILHAHLRLPAVPGPLTLIYPQWIPGEHGPNGPMVDVVDLKFSTAGKTIEWQRDAEDMFAFHLTVPAGADNVEIGLDFLLPPDSSGEGANGCFATAQLLDLVWNQLLLYPKDAKLDELQYAATLRLPKGWHFGTALPVAKNSSSRIEFAPVSLITLVDSPLIAGAHFRSIALTPGSSLPHWLHMVGDSESALDIKPEDQRHYTHLVAEANALFGAHHYQSYSFLVTLSDQTSNAGLEHHECSDDRAVERYLVDEDELKNDAELLAHELVHSWNGKYRRPAGLATPGYHESMKGELLWVYEGLTDYLGVILSARSGLWSNSNLEEYLAWTAAHLEVQPGRNWRPLADTAIAAQLLYNARKDGAARRRGVDFYSEGDLIWLEADVLIRQQTEGRKSLDDFCRKFHGGESGGPKVVPYTLNDVIAALNEIAPMDWRQFFQKRVYQINPHAPLGGIEGAGWRLVYNDKLSDYMRAREVVDKVTDLSFSIGLELKEDGTVNDVIPGLAADQSGIAPNVKLLAVNGRHWTPTVLRTAINATKTNNASLELLIENKELYTTHKLNYHGGDRYPHLERDATKPDLLTRILTPLTPAPR
jgi:predicted metalloprotease with PDZ domain